MVSETEKVLLAYVEENSLKFGTQGTTFVIY